MNYDDDRTAEDVQAEVMAFVTIMAIAVVVATGVVLGALWGLWRLAEWLLTVRVLV